MKSSTLLKWLTCLLVAVFVIHQLISSLYSPVKTETAVYDTVTDGFNITGIIIRNERLVEYSGGGVMHFVIKDGGRVAKGGTVANVYDSESASIAVTKTKELEEKIADIEDILSYNDIEAANLELINERISEKLDKLIASASTGSFASVRDYSAELLSAMNRKQAAMGVTEDLSAELASLKAQLPGTLSDPKQKITAEQSGYFVSQTDGYENIFSTEDLKKITPELLDSAVPEESRDSVIGKIVSDYEWYIAAEVSVSEAVNFKEGESLKINTSVKSSPTLNVTVKSVNNSESSSRAVVLFACKDMNSELASMRSGPMTVVKSEYSGLKVPKSALRVVDSVRGVYVLSGMQIHFVPIEVLYSGESFIVCEKQTDTDKALKLYDTVVVKGRKLYDGKIVG